MEQLKKLLYLFYKVWGFGAAKKKYKLSNMIWIDSVFINHTGTAISLGIIFLHIAKILKISIVPVIFPTQFILRVNDINSEVFFINPFNGEILNQRMLEYWLKGNISPTTILSLKDISETKPLKVIQKLLDTLKVSLIEERSIDLALRVSNVLLKINPKDPYERRDRGLIFSQLECYNMALLDLIYFIEHCPDDPVSEIIKAQIHSIQQKKNIVH
nr:tetratricopeptide repeat protein [Buchnera aphidicola]